MHRNALPTRGTIGPSLSVVANRLPVAVGVAADGSKELRPSAGGLVHALEPLLRRHGGTWFGWPGVAVGKTPPPRAFRRLEETRGYGMVPIPLETRDIVGYYRGFSNAVLWPLFHGFADRCVFEPAYWDSYVRVNARFARILRDAAPAGPLWIHDYHLIAVGSALRSSGWGGPLGFFLHIPFPSVDDLARLPWRAELLRTVLSYNLVGVQTRRDLAAFLHCVQSVLPEVSVELDGARARLRLGGCETMIGAFPIGIDVDEREALARGPQAQRAAEDLVRTLAGTRLLLGVDRLDYSKGLIERLRAFDHLLRRNSELLGAVTLIQLTVPSREGVSDYDSLKTEVQRLVGEINGRHGTVTWTPIRYLYTSLDKGELAALYRAADVALVTSLRDGMNLVSKEFIASKVDADGALVLSEAAGAVEQLAEHAIVVNPYDVEGLATAIERALNLPEDERRRRMVGLRRAVARHDVFAWAESFFDALRNARVARPSVAEALQVRLNPRRFRLQRVVAPAADGREA